MLELAARHARPGVPLPRQRPRRRLPAGRAALRRPLRAAQHATGSSGSGSAPRSPTPARPDDAARDRLASIDCCFPTAEFQEREVYDFFGIVFRGHPDLRRILMPEIYVGWPQRRDFPVGGEPVIFTHNEHQVPGWFAVSVERGDARRARRQRPASGGDVIAETAAPVIGTSPIERTEAGELLEPEHELLTVNMGPHHPATHGVLRLLVSLEGEVVRDLKPVDRLRPHRDREVLRGQELLEGDPVRRADGLPLLLLQHGGVLRRGRAAARARDPAARQVPADPSTWS